MLWLHLHFPHLLVDHIRSCSDRPAALAVVDNSGQEILQACPLACNLGVVAGMRLKTAISLAPELHIHRMEQAQELRILGDQARWLYRYAAHIVLLPPDGLLAEISSLEKLYGGLPSVWQTVEEALHKRQLTAWLGLGHTPLAARLIARSGQGECTCDKDHINRVLSHLPLQAAEFEARTLTRLQRLGLNTLGEVFSLSPAETARRLAPETLAYLQKIQGTRPDPRPPWQPPHYFQQQADFVQEIEQTQGLLFPLQRLLIELEKDLRWRQQDTDCLLLRLYHRHAEATRLRIRTSGPEHRAEAFLGLANLRLEQQPLQAPVTALRLTVKRFLGRDTATGQDLLGEGQNLNEAWHTLISRLQARLGEPALRQLAPRADHRPEQAWQALAIQRQKHSDPNNPLQAKALPRRPLWLLHGPQALTEMPEVWLSGPERISGGWWDGQRVQRDYYIARLRSGQLAWVFRDVREGWFVHGWFG